MGYMDAFYVVGNIVAYTGDPNVNPTVYFQVPTGAGTQFGRITQDHGNPNNIGRNEVRIKADYRLENRQLVDNVYLCGLIVTHRTACVEFYDGRDRHTSRNAAVFLADFAPNVGALLAQAIILFQDRKNK